MEKKQYKFIKDLAVQNINWFLLVHLIGTSLSKSHIDRNNGSHTQNNGIYMYLSIYLFIYLHVHVHVCLYHLPHICRTLVPEVCLCPEILCEFQYIEVLMCVIYMYNCTRLNSKAGWSYSLSAVKILNEDR